MMKSSSLFRSRKRQSQCSNVSSCTTATGVVNNNRKFFVRTMTSDFISVAILTVLMGGLYFVKEHFNPLINITSSQDLALTTAHRVHVPVSDHLRGTAGVNISLVSLAPRTCRDNAIVLMAQKKHTTYDRDSYGLMLKALDLLYENYLSIGNHSDNVDIFIFHTGDFDERDLLILEPRVSPKRTGMVHLVNLLDTPYWQLPPWHIHDNRNEWAVNHIFPVGYRHMCRWFGIKIWNFFEDLNHRHGCNYRYIFRIDEDSFIHSPISYNVFDFMKNNQYVYGYRMCAYEIDYNKLVHGWFSKWQNIAKPKRELDFRLCGFYNNFFVADLQFFRSFAVREFLREIDRRGFIYRKRYGDLIIHSMAVYAFAETRQVHRFLDFTYQHVTIDHILTPEKGCVVWGGIQAGYNDPKADETLDEYYQKRVLRRGCTANVTFMGEEDLSPSYAHVPPELKGKISLQTIVAGKVELPGQGIFSG